MRRVRVPRRWQWRISVAAIVSVVVFFVARAADAAVWWPWPTISCAADPRLQQGRYAGVYNTETHLVVIWPAWCDELESLQAGGPATWRGAFALFVVAHELSHASGIAGEAEADCHAALIYAGVGRRLHVGDQVGELEGRLLDVVDLSGCRR